MRTTRRIQADLSSSAVAVHAPAGFKQSAVLRQICQDYIGAVNKQAQTQSKPLKEQKSNVK